MTPRLDYDDIVYNKQNNESFSNKVVKAQHDATLPLTDAFRNTSRERERRYAELGLQSLKLR